MEQATSGYLSAGWEAIRRRKGPSALAAVLLLLLVVACRRAASRPSLTVAPTMIEPGAIVTVQGRNWPAGKRVVVALQRASNDSEGVVMVEAPVDGAGNFAELFKCPEQQGLPPPTGPLGIIAYTPDRAAEAHATLAWVSATPTLSSSPTPTAQPAGAYVLGTVRVVGVDALTIEPTEGTARVVRTGDETRFLAGGIADVKVGDLIEAYGQRQPDEAVVADWLRIVRSTGATATHMPTPTSTRTITPTPTGTPNATWRGEYFANTTFSGSPVLRRSDAAIDFQWPNEPAEGLPADQFGVRWTGTWAFETGAYRFFAQVDDGVRLWLDAHLIVDRWHESTGALYSADARLSAGSHDVRVEYFDGQGSGHAKVWWEFLGTDVQPVYTDWRGEYFEGTDLLGTPVLTLNERVIDMNWGTGAPSPALPADGFSARWTRSATFAEGTYRFRVRADDGVRLYVDSQLVIGEWHESAAKDYTAEVYLSGGNHNLQLDYYERTGNAIVSLSWDLLPATATPTPTATATATETPLPPTPTATRQPPPTATATRQPTRLPKRTATPARPKATPRPTRQKTRTPGRSGAALGDWLGTPLR